MVDLNDLAREITLREGKKISLPIAQVKEVMHLTLKYLKDMHLADVISLLNKVK